MRSEREVREAVLRDVGNPFGTLSDVEVSLDAYREAVRQSAFAEARKAVEGAKRIGMEEAEASVRPNDEFDAVLHPAMLKVLEAGFDTSLAALDALATPPDTGTPG